MFDHDARRWNIANTPTTNAERHDDDDQESATIDDDDEACRKRRSLADGQKAARLSSRPAVATVDLAAVDDDDSRLSCRSSTLVASIVSSTDDVEDKRGLDRNV